MRKHERFTVDMPEITAELLFSEDTSIRNISLGGISLTADKGLKIDKEYTIKIRIHDKVVPVKGTVMWCKLCQSKNRPNGDIIPIYSIGLQFRDDPKGDLAELVEFLRSYQTPLAEEMNFPGNDSDLKVLSREHEEMYHLVHRDLHDREKVFAVLEG
ncbi:MAG: PilZ domain-containing protein [Thermodesulfovibrionales bacterium]|nr:PilZ domain-containing protein [Thermodesulfovibrionales bacterium]